MFSWNITDEISKYIKLLSNNNPVLTIIPSDSEHPKSEIFKEDIVGTFKKYWIKKINYYPVDTWVFNKNIYEESDIIYLSWGNTKVFLENLKNNFDFDKLKKFVNRWWLLMWLSAWSIIMTPNIWTDNSNEVWLNLVNFEFFPHYSNQDNDFLLEYSKINWNIIYGVPGNSWIIVNWKDISFIWWDLINIFKNWEINKLI